MSKKNWQRDSNWKEKPSALYSDFWLYSYVVLKQHIWFKEIFKYISKKIKSNIERHHSNTGCGMEAISLKHDSSLFLMSCPTSSSSPLPDVLVFRARGRGTITQLQHLHPLPDNCAVLRVESTLIPATALLSAEKASPCIHKCASIKHPTASRSYIISSLTLIIYPVTPHRTHSTASVVVYKSFCLELRKRQKKETKTKTSNHKWSQQCVIKAGEVIYYWWVMWSPSGKPCTPSISLIPTWNSFSIYKDMTSANFNTWLMPSHEGDSGTKAWRPSLYSGEAKFTFLCPGTQ